MTAPIDPLAENAFRRGLALHRMGELDNAEACYRQALLTHPAHGNALLMMGLLALAKHDSARAVEWFTMALEADPTNADAHNGLGSALLEVHEHAAALARFDAAISLRSGFTDAHYNRANLFLDGKDYCAALEGYDRALACDPAFVPAHNNRGLALSAMKRHDEALASFDRAIQLAPGNADALHYRGNTLQDLQRYTAAIASYDQAIHVRPDYTEAFYARGNALALLREYEAAIASYDQALLRNPDEEFLLGLRRHLKMQICDWQEFDADLRELILRIARGESVSPPLPWLSLSDDPQLQKMVATRWADTHYPVGESVPRPAQREVGPRIRVGYFSPDFRDHPVSALTAPLYELHDRRRFEIFGLCFGDDTGDAMRARLERAFDRFIDVKNRSDAEIVGLARALSLDIAVDLAGYTQDCRPGVFAMRAAPLQVGYLGYPGTTASSCMDYLIGDKIVVPHDMRRHYTEMMIDLPNSFMIYDSGRAIAKRVFTRSELGLPADVFVFCCFNNCFKITPATFDSWMRILARVEDSVLWLAAADPTAMRNLRREAERRGVGAHRVIFAARFAAASDHLARLRAADLFLDTLPYNAHATAADALWAGLPVLTRTGKSFASRVAASLLNAVGLCELVTSSAAAFEEAAVALASDPGRMGAVKTKLAAKRLDAALFDASRFVRDLESAYLTIHERRLAGAAAAPVGVHGA